MGGAIPKMQGETRAIALSSAPYFENAPTLGLYFMPNIQSLQINQNFIGKN
jgi:hypothetical protein